ncbi:hypothetical protein MLPF_3381 [Mycobacterium lepromatosis]|nr:hypothetical protein MLPF_3381 [Mycobacterium lepromatosis]
MERELTDHGLTHLGGLHCSSDASPELIRKITFENDFALTAIDTYGSCYSAFVNDVVHP